MLRPFDVRRVARTDGMLRAHRPSARRTPFIRAVFERPECTSANRNMAHKLEISHR